MCRRINENRLGLLVNRLDSCNIVRRTLAGTMPRAPKGYRFSGRHLFLTYPKCDTPLDTILKRAQENWDKQIITYLIADEKHEDGSDHRHCYFHLSKTIDTIKPDFFDFLTGKHGNYQTCRSPKNVMEYVSKGGDFLANFDVKAKIASMTSKKSYIATKLVMEKQPVEDFMTENPEMMMDAPAIKRAIECYQLLTAKPRDPNVCQPEIHIYWGPSGSGKSLYAFNNYPGAYWLSRTSDRGEGWWDGYAGQKTVVIDEFYGWLTYDFVLRLADRYPLHLNTKGGRLVCQVETVVFTSNKPYKDWWNLAEDRWPALERRIKKDVYMEKPRVEASTGV